MISLVTPIPRRISLKTLVAAVLVPLVLGACGPSPQKTETKVATAKPALTVELISPTQESWPEQLAASGNVMPWQEASVSAEINGVRLVKVLVNVGDVVRKGQVLARLNSDPVQADLDAAGAGVAEARAALGQAVATLERAKRLAPGGGVSKQDLAQYTTQKLAAEARLRLAKAQRKNQSLRLGFTVLTAPYDGVVSAQNAVEGEVVQAGKELFRLIREQRLEWRAELKGESLLKLKAGQLALISTPLGAIISGRIRQVAPTVDVISRNGLVYVDLLASPELKAGLYVSGHFILQDKTALAVPLESLAARDGKMLAFKINEDSRVAAVEVQIGRTLGKRVEVLSGLNVEDRIVSRGAGFLKTGDLVQVVTASKSVASR